jgi:hypothetical protein
VLWNGHASAAAASDGPANDGAAGFLLSVPFGRLPMRK